MTTGHRLFCKEPLRFDDVPGRHTPLLALPVHSWPYHWGGGLPGTDEAGEVGIIMIIIRMNNDNSNNGNSNNNNNQQQIIIMIIIVVVIVILTKNNNNRKEAREKGDDRVALDRKETRPWTCGKLHETGEQSHPPRFRSWPLSRLPKSVRRGNTSNTLVCVYCLLYVLFVHVLVYCLNISLSLSLYIYIYTHACNYACMYICIYIYIERERDWLIVGYHCFIRFWSNVMRPGRRRSWGGRAPPIK